MSTPAALSYRPSTPADLASCADVLDVADDDLSERRGLPIMPRNRPALLRLFEHLLSLYPTRSWLAEAGGRTVGFGSAAEYGDLVFLSFLFVLPDHQDRGVGRELMERAMHDSQYRGVCINSVQPISAALYARYGMAPLVPIFMFLDAPKRALPTLPAGMELRPIGDADTGALDRDLCGFERPSDHELWRGLGRQRFGLYERGSAVGYGYVQESGRLGPIVSRRRELILPFLGRLMDQVPPVEGWMVNVPGPASDTFVGLLQAGMRLEGPPAVFCATEARIDHSRYLPASFALP